MQNKRLSVPLVPADTDIRGLDGFMLDVQRLLGSELWALSTGDEFKAAVGLWSRAWTQQPPGSLPNDERVLASFSGAGDNWPNVRAMALRGFVLCRDGKLYHPVLCEDALRAAQKKAEFRARTTAATEARKAKRRANLERDDKRTVERDVDVTEPQGQGQGQGRRILRILRARGALCRSGIQISNNGG
jgi:hypothetical protein